MCYKQEGLKCVKLAHPQTYVATYATLLLAVLCSCQYGWCTAQPSTGGLEEREVVVTSGLELLGAIRNYTGNYHIIIRAKAKEPGGVVLLNTSGVNLPLPPMAAPQGIPNGRVTFMPDDQNMETVYADLGNRAYIMPQLSGSSMAFMYNATLVGYCFYPYQLRFNPDVVVVQSLSAIFWSLTPYSNAANTGRRFNSWNNMVYSTEGEVALQKYIFVMLDLEKVPEVAPYAKIWLDRFLVVHPQHQIIDVTPWSLSYNALYPAVAVTNFTLASVDDPHGPIRRGLIGMPELRYCLDDLGNGSLVEPRVQPLDTSVSPLWTATQDGELHHALLNASTHLTTPNAVDWPMVVMVLGNVSLPAATQLQAQAGNGSSSSYLIPGTLVLGGPFNHIPAYAKTIAIDLGGAAAPAFTLAPNPNGTALVIFSLLLRGLAVADIRGSPWAPANTSSYLSALPLWGLVDATRAPGSWLRLYKATLELPQADYAALLAAAIRGDAWQSGANATAPLLAGITKFNLASSALLSLGSTRQSQLPASFRLLQFTGWGIDASELTLRPDVPLPPLYPLPDIVLRAEQGEEHGSSDHNRSVRIGVGVGVGVGCGLILIALATAAAVFYHRQKVKEAQYAAASKARAPLDSIAGYTITIDSQANGRSVNSKSHLNGGPMSKDELRSYLSLNLQAGKLSLEGALEVMTLGSVVHARASKAGSMYSQRSTLSEKDVKRAVASAADVLNAGQADKLTLTGVLGRGAYGVVYEGTWRNLRVAVKTLIFSSSPVAKGKTGEIDAAGTKVRMSGYERAVKEAAVCTTMAHRNVVATYRYEIKALATRQEAGQYLEVDVDGVPPEQASDFKLYIIQERCDANLAEAIDYQILGSLPGSSKLAIHLYLLLDLSRGVEYLHLQNIIHGDLKTDNVLLKLDKTSKLGVTLKLTDFGLAQALDPGATHVSNFRGGTRFFIAPEVLGEGRAGRPSDVYALGVCAWCVLHGRHPYVVGQAGEFLLHPDFPHPPPDLATQDDPAVRSVVSIMSRCLITAPAGRPTAHDVVAELERLVATLPD